MSQHVKMLNDVYELIPGFVLDNARYSARGRSILEAVGGALRGDEPDLPVVQPNTRYGHQLALCGAGPSLNAALPLLRRFRGDIWGCNSALPYLQRHGVRVTHGCAIDQTPGMFETRWNPIPTGLDYYLATSCHPILLRKVLEAGNPVTLFHSFIGYAGEMEACGNLYPTTIWVGDGYNVVNRLLQVALYLGYSRICLVGADCALGRADALHYDGQPTARTAYGHILDGVIDGRRWRTHPDLAMSAVDLIRQQRAWGDRIELWGDTLPNALRAKSEAFLSGLPKPISQPTRFDVSGVKP